MTTVCNHETMTIGPADNMESRDDINNGLEQSADEKTDGEVEMENA